MHEYSHKPDCRVAHDAWQILDCPALAQSCYDVVAVGEGVTLGAMDILFTNDAQICELNKQFRNKDAPTNVLSFPADDATFLGDVVLAYETCVREAEEKEISLHDHCAHLIIHGVLHLLGYDHQDTVMAEEMEQRERVLLKTMGISDPYPQALEME